MDALLENLNGFGLLLLACGAVIVLIGLTGFFKKKSN
jgi:hypothetical protein